MKLFLLVTFCNLLITTAVYATSDKITTNGNDIVINKTNTYKNILSNYQNNNIFLAKFNGEQVLKRNTESISKERIILTFNNDKTAFDCIYSSQHSYFTRLPIAKSVCGLNLAISETTMDNLHTYLEDKAVNEGKQSDLNGQPITFKLVSIKDISISILANSIDDILEGNSSLVIKNSTNTKNVKLNDNNTYYIEFNLNKEPIALVLYNGTVKKLNYDELSNFINK